MKHMEEKQKRTIDAIIERLENTRKKSDVERLQSDFAKLEQEVGIIVETLSRSIDVLNDKIDALNLLVTSIKAEKLEQQEEGEE